MATCMYCGSEIPEGLKFCTACGAALPVEATVDSGQQPIDVSAQVYQQPGDQQQYQQSYQQPGYQQPYGQQTPVQPVNDSGSIGWAILGFFIPLVGLILFLVWRTTKPKCAKMAGIGALVGFILSLGVNFLYLPTLGIN